MNTTPLALITGGSRGIGRSTALHLARAGIDVVITYHSAEAEAQSVVRAVQELGRKAFALQLDVAQSKSFAPFVELFGQTLRSRWQRTTFDFLVNNAGTGLEQTFAETTEDQFDELLDVHFRGVFFLTQRLLPSLADGGRIVNVSSGLTRITLPGYSAYAAMKGAIETLTRYWAKELGPRGIAVNVIAPGAIETDFRGGAVRDNPAMNKMIASLTALGRVGLPDDVGGAVAALLSPGSAWVNGQRIEVSGGMAL